MGLKLYGAGAGPEITTSQGTMGAPGFGEGENGFLIIPADAIEPFDGGPKTEVPHRKDVGAFERKNEKHLGGPGADAFDFS